MISRRWISLSLGLLIAFAPLCASAAPPEERDEPGDLVITLKPGKSIEALNRRYGTTTLEQIRGTDTFRVMAPQKNKTLKRLRTDSAVRKAGVNTKVRRHQTVSFPNDNPVLLPPGSGAQSLYDGQLTKGALSSLGIETAISLAEGGTDVIVAVLDTGIDPTHPTIAGHLWTNPDDPQNGIDDDGNGFVDDTYGYDFLDDDADPNEVNTSGSIVGHGTFIAGLITLAAPRVRIMPLRVLNADGVGSSFDAAEAIDYATAHGARIISMSFGAETGAPPLVLRDAVRSAADQGVVMVAAVGNDNSTQVAYPASDTRRVISVGAVTGDGERAYFSNFGSVDVAAPGVDLISAMPGSYESGEPRFAVWSGTSFATGLISAVSGLLVQADTTASPDTIRARLVDNPVPGTNKDSVGTRVSFLESVGSILRDAGALDVWSQAEMHPPESPDSVGGYVILRAIGQAERITAYGWGLEPFSEYHLFARLLDDSQDVYLGTTQADFLGNVKLIASDSPTAPDIVELPFSLTEMAGLGFLDHNGVPVRIALVDPESPGVQVWAGVGLRAQYDDPDNRAFGRAWYAYDRGAYQNFYIATCAVAPLRQHVLFVNGVEVARGDSSDDGNGFGSIEFYFSSDPNEIRGGARELSDFATPEISPVTQITTVELYRVNDNGSLTPLIIGQFAGAARMMPKTR